MSDKLTILILDDDKLYATMAHRMLKKDFAPLVALSPSNAFNIFKQKKIDILICDFHLPEMNGIEVIKEVSELYPETEIIMISADADKNTVIDALKLGAADFFNKPFNFDDIILSIEKTKKFKSLKTQVHEFEVYKSVVNDELKGRNDIEIISSCSEMQMIKEIMYKVAQTDDTSVLITGESGTGKELVAKSIHYLSERKGNYFAAVNASAIPNELFESEFFGHKKGAFTGAIKDRAGWFEIANKGTLFLDEIGDMPYNLQIKLLRVLEDRKYVKVGSQSEHLFDVRIVAATNKNIREAENENFRLDLLHRLSTFEIRIPALRERTEDIPLLLNHFIKTFTKKMKKNSKKIDAETIKNLSRYSFPGNIRELKNLVERAVILCDDDMITSEYFPIIQNNNTAPQNGEDIFDLEIVEKNTILKALKKAGNNKSYAAELLNIKWNALHRRLAKYDIAVN